MSSAALSITPYPVASSPISELAASKRIQVLGQADHVNGWRSYLNSTHIIKLTVSYNVVTAHATNKFTFEGYDGSTKVIDEDFDVTSTGWKTSSVVLDVVINENTLSNLQWFALEIVTGAAMTLSDVSFALECYRVSE